MAGDIVFYKFRLWQIGLAALVAGLVVLTFYGGLQQMVSKWGDEEYGHGYMLPFVAVFFVWQKSALVSKRRLLSTGRDLVLEGRFGRLA